MELGEIVVYISHSKITETECFHSLYTKNDPYSTRFSTLFVRGPGTGLICQDVLRFMLVLFAVQPVGVFAYHSVACLSGWACIVQQNYQLGP